MAGKGAPKGNQYAKKSDTGRTISVYLTADDMALLRHVLDSRGESTSDERCIKLAKMAAKMGINQLLFPVKEETHMRQMARWIEGEIFTGVGIILEALGYVAPDPDVPGSTGAYLMNIANQYQASLSKKEILDIVTYAEANKPETLLQQIKEEGLDLDDVRGAFDLSQGQQQIREMSARSFGAM